MTGENSTKCRFSVNTSDILYSFYNILTSKNESEPMLSISTVKFMLSCLEEIYSGTNVQIQVIQKVKKESST